MTDDTYPPYHPPPQTDAGSCSGLEDYLGQPIVIDIRSPYVILGTLRHDGRLLSTYRDGLAKGMAFLDDYAFLADGLLDLHEATGEARWIDEAKGLMEVLLEHYRSQDPVTMADNGFFFVADDHENLLLRTRDAYDKAIPSGNGGEGSKRVS